MSEYRVKVFQYLHRPYQVLFFEEDELILLVLFLFMAFVFGGIFWVLPFPLVFGYSSFKKKFPRGYLKHILYAIGLVSFKNCPSFFEDRFSE